ncbi:MAG TPA: serine hydroxymethyltransferase, partial [Candidatus Obscuribacterales bacterium]
LGEVQITVNKNTVPNDPKSPFVTSGLRLGTPAVTTRGMLEADMRVLADCLAEMIREPESEEVRASVSSRVAELCRSHPLYKKD